MSGTMDAIGDRVSPGRVVSRRVDRARQASTRVRHHIMGPPRSAASSVKETAGSATDTVSDAMSTVGAQVQQAPQRITEGAQGNPLAAGAVAFGLGVLLGSLAPPTREEERVAEKVLPAVQDEAKAIGQAVAESARDNAQQAVEDVKGQAQEAAEEVRGRAEEAAGQVKEQAQGAAEDVKGQAQDATTQVKDQVTGS
jgi:uncharacterized protein YjbJ (UPF0337 family)